MARTSNVFARVEPEIKEQAEQVLERLGIPMSNAVGMFLRQVVLQRGIPFGRKTSAGKNRLPMEALQRNSLMRRWKKAWLIYGKAGYIRRLK